MARVYKNVEKIVANLPGVRDAVHHEAEKGAARAEARLAAHRYANHARIDLEAGERDSFVSLVDEAALSIEFGGFNHWANRMLPGLYIVNGAFDTIKPGWRGNG